MPGDKIQIEVYAKYVDPTSSNWTGALTTLMGQIASGTAGVVIDGSGYSAGTSTSSFPYAGLLSTASSSSNGPKAYLNWLVFDKNFVFISSGYVRMTNYGKEDGQNAPHEKLASPDIIIDQPGYVYAYISNEEPSNAPVEVYFDDFKVTQLHSPFVAGGDYYPFGLPMDDRQMDAEPYKFGYQGQYAEKDSLMKMNSFQLRMYDAKYAVNHTPDPYGQYASGYVGMGNNPVSGVDPDGGWLSSFNWTGAAIGAAAGAGVGLAFDKDNWWKYSLGGAAGGGFLTSDFAKVNIWGTHTEWGLVPAKNGKETIRPINSIVSSGVGNVAPLNIPNFGKPQISNNIAQGTINTIIDIGSHRKNSVDFNPSGGGIRTQDCCGTGNYGAPRDNGKRDHKGIDIVTITGQNLAIPVDGTMKYFADHSGVDIIPSNPSLRIEVIRILYVTKPAGFTDGVSYRAQAGDLLGTAANLSKPPLGYPAAITPHIHVQVKVGGQWSNPTRYFFPGR